MAELTPEISWRSWSSLSSVAGGGDGWRAASPRLSCATAASFTRHCPRILPRHRFPQAVALLTASSPKSRVFRGRIRIIATGPGDGNATELHGRAPVFAADVSE